jgi:hypothetical protein
MRCERRACVAPRRDVAVFPGLSRPVCRAAASFPRRDVAAPQDRVTASRRVAPRGAAKTNWPTASAGAAQVRVTPGVLLVGRRRAADRSRGRAYSVCVVGWMTGGAGRTGEAEGAHRLPAHGWRKTRAGGYARRESRRSAADHECMQVHSIRNARGPWPRYVIAKAQRLVVRAR